jgi:F-type H+-transporting ATPase subunit b
MKRPWLAVLATLVLSAAAMASEEGHAEHGGIPVATLLFSTVNLAIFLGILARYVLPLVRENARERHTRVVEALAEAARAKADAELLRSQCEARLAQIDAEIEEIHARAREAAERERERILAAAHRTADAIRKDAERAAASELRLTQEQLRAELARQAVQLAAESTRAHWSAADQQRSLAEFLTQVRR